MEGEPDGRASPDEPRADETALAGRVLDIALAVLYSKDEDRVIEVVGRTMMTLFPIKKLVIYVTDRATGNWFIRFVVGYPEDQARDIKKVVYSRDSWDETLQVYRKLGPLTYLAPGEAVKIDDYDTAFYRGFPEEIPPRRSPDHMHMMDFVDTILFDKDGRELGAIEVLETTDGMIPSADFISKMEVLASIASIALELTRLWKSQEALVSANSNRARVFARMLSITTRMVSIRREELILAAAADFLTNDLGFANSRPALWDRRSNRYVLLSSAGLPEKDLTLTRDAVYRDLGDTYRFTEDLYWIPARQLDAARLSLMPFTPASAQEVSAANMEHTGTSSPDGRFDLFAVPLRDRRNEVVGVIYATDRASQDGLFEKDLLEVMSVFGSIVSLAFRNSQLIRETVRSNEDLDMINRLLFHDVSNYNTGIGTYLDIASTPESSAEMKAKGLAAAMKQLDLSNELINRVRKIVYIRDRGAEKMLTVDLVSTLASLVEEARAARSDRRLGITIRSEESQCLVRANELIHDLFQNLLDNSIKYDRHDSVEVGVSVAKAVEEGKEFWDVSISDRGVGVPDDQKERIFDRFADRMSGGKGLGLGLSIVRAITEMYGGRIWVEDRVDGDPSQGATFHVLLPAV